MFITKYMEVKFKKLNPSAVQPSYAKNGDAGLDLTAIDVVYDEASGCLVYDTGLAIEIPQGYVGLLFCRSSVKEKSLFLSNHTGIIDSGFRGSIKLAFKFDFDFWGCPHDDESFAADLKGGNFVHYGTAADNVRKITVYRKVYAVGDRVGQLIIMPYPQIELVEAEELSTTERGTGGYGHTGR